MAATISELGNVAVGRHIVVLGAMKELGVQSDYYHTGLAGPMKAAKIDFAILIGNEMQILADQLKSGLEGPSDFAHCVNTGEALALLQNMIQANDNVLIKGSNSVGLSAIIKAYVGGES